MTYAVRASALRIVFPLNAVITSPFLSPAFAAGEPATTSPIFAPPFVASPIRTPIHACWTVPPAMRVCAEAFTTSIGAANPIPTFASTVPAGIWSLIPITVFVATSMSGPPELPWLIAASVWIVPGIEKPFGA